MSFAKSFIVSTLTFIHSSAREVGYVPFDGVVEEVIRTPRPHTYISSSELPEVWDWRNINGTNLCNHVYSQETPSHCGSCWAEAATGALSDRYVIATGGKLRLSLAPQNLLNFNTRTTGGSCNGGDHLKAYEFIYKYGISDDTCAAKIGLDRIHSFHVASMTDTEDVQDHLCYECDWTGPCGFIDRDEYSINLYGVEEYGTVYGVNDMKAEIYARGPIACLINSEPPEFDKYKGGVMTCDNGPLCNIPKYTDHVIVIAGWGVEAETGTPYWVGRNSYGTKWGEGG